jgi:hypothetical protein
MELMTLRHGLISKTRREDLIAIEGVMTDYLEG